MFDSCVGVGSTGVLQLGPTKWTVVFGRSGSVRLQGLTRRSYIQQMKLVPASEAKIDYLKVYTK